MIIQLGLGIEPGSAAVAGEAPDIPIGQPTITALPFDGYVFDAAGTASATVTLSGTGDANAAVRVRGYSAAGSTSWIATTSDALGDWSVTIDMPDTAWAPWYTPQARYGSNGAIASSANTFGCGDVIGFLGQSEITYFHALGNTYNTLPYPALAAQNMTVLLQDDSTGVVSPTRVTTADSSSVNIGLVAIANLLHHIRPNRKVMVVDMNQPGTSRGDLMADADTDRSFTHLSDIVALVRSAGSDIGLIVENWYNADAASILDIGPNFAPWYFGQRWGGEAFVLGSTNPDHVVRPAMVYDHCLWDIEAASDQLGRGIFARDRTKLTLMGPMPFNDTPVAPDPEWDNFTGTGPRLVEPVRDNIRAFTQDSRMQTFCVGYGTSTHLTDFGGGIHPLPSDAYGTVQFALMHAPALLGWMGTTVEEPMITDIDVADDGTYADILVSLPNDGDLSTIRGQAGLSDPAVLPPHYQPVVGFEITRAGGARRPVFGLTETGYPSAHRGVVSIQDIGSGAPRIGKIRITPEEPFSTGDQISYLLGQTSAALLEPRDTDAKLHLNMLMEHVPALYNGADTYPFRGVPVAPQVVAPTIALPVASFVARGAAFDGNTNYASNAISTPAGSSGLMSFWFRNRDSAWNVISGGRICQFRVGSSTAFEIKTASSGRLQFRLNQDGTGSDVLTTPTNTFSLNQWHHIAWSWDFTTSRFQLYVDGVALTTSGYAFGTTGFQISGNNITRIGIASQTSSASKWLGDIGHFWLDTSQTLDLSVPANLQKFLLGTAPVDLGQMGGTPTGVVPQYYYDGDGAAWSNLGTAGNVTLTGAITASDLIPSL